MRGGLGKMRLLLGKSEKRWKNIPVNLALGASRPRASARAEPRCCRLAALPHAGRPEGRPGAREGLGRAAAWPGQGQGPLASALPLARDGGARCTRQAQVRRAAGGAGTVTQGSAAVPQWNCCRES